MRVLSYASLWKWPSTVMDIYDTVIAYKLQVVSLSV